MAAFHVCHIIDSAMVGSSTPLSSTGSISQGKLFETFFHIIICVLERQDGADGAVFSASKDALSLRTLLKALNRDVNKHSKTALNG